RKSSSGSPLNTCDEVCCMNADYQEIMELTEDPKIIEYSQTLNLNFLKKYYSNALTRCNRVSKSI
ncbi:MAG: hypothetical protein ACOYJ1_16135, partial [Peptococcales bacterium]